MSENNKISRSEKEPGSPSVLSKFWELSNRQKLVAVGLTLLLSLGALGAVNRISGDALFARLAETVGIKKNSAELISANPQTATPQLSKEYIYAGSRMLAIEDYQSSGSTPTPTPTMTPTATPTPGVTPTPTPTPNQSRVNYALASNGSGATASSADPNFPSSFGINGDRAGTNMNVWVSGVGLPQWLEVSFNQSRTIDEINVVTVQDNYQSPVEPTLTTTFTSTHANTGFDVQYWDGSAWVNITSVTGNNKIWRQFTFSPITTTKVRVVVTATGDNYAYLTEVEAWGN